VPSRRWRYASNFTSPSTRAVAQSVVAIGPRLREGGVARCDEQNGEGGGFLLYIPSRKLGRSVLVLLAPFSDDGQRILDVFLRVEIGVGVKDLSFGRNDIGNAVGEGRAYNRNVERGVIGLDDRKAGVRAHREFVAAFLRRKVTLHFDLVARNANDARAGGREILDVFGESDPIRSTSRSLEAA
jgi:hypothetical protein